MPNKRAVVAAKSASVSPAMIAAGFLAALLVAWLAWKFLLTSRDRFEVYGMVTRAGRPIEVPNCRLVFTHKTTQRAAVGILDDSGKYRVYNHKESGLPPGIYDVVVSFPPDYLPPLKSPTEAFSRDELEKQLARFIPRKYRDPATSGLTLEVTDHDVELSVDMTD